MARLRDTPRASRSTLVVAAPPAASMAAATSSRAWASAAADRATSRSTLTIARLSESSRRARVMVSRSSCSRSPTSGSVGASRPASSSKATIRSQASRTTRAAAAAECGSNTSAPSAGTHAARAALGNQGCGNCIVSGGPSSMGNGAGRKARLLGSRGVHGGQGRRQGIHRSVEHHGGTRVQRPRFTRGKRANGALRHQPAQRGIDLADSQDPKPSATSISRNRQRLQRQPRTHTRPQHLRPQAPRTARAPLQQARANGGSATTARAPHQ